jgi:hypothetical protein
MSAYRARVLAELAHRVALFPHEIDRLQAAVAADEDGLRIHTTQIGVLRILMAELLQRQREFLERLGGDIPDADLADGVAALLYEEMSGAQKVWNIFSQAFAARRTPELAPHFDTADLVAAECYLLAIAQARNWGILDEAGLREPPLVCPEAFQEPVTLGRSALVGGLGTFCDAGWRFHDLRLPIPLVLMPTDQIACVWLLPALCHEVGHDVDGDLGLTTEIKRCLGESPALATERRSAWQTWSPEIVADAFGVLVGSAGFAEWLAALVLPLAPGARFRELDPSITHPHPLVRVPVLAAMLRRLGVPALADVALRLDGDARAVPAPEGIAPFLGEADAVASVVLTTKLSALCGHALVELNPELGTDVRKARDLADFLASGELRPSPDQPAAFPFRLVPVAAQLAVAAASPGPASLAAVQQRAAEFVAAIPRPPFLDSGARLTPRRAAAVARMARQVSFQVER